MAEGAPDAVTQAQLEKLRLEMAEVQQRLRRGWVDRVVLLVAVVVAAGAPWLGVRALWEQPGHLVSRPAEAPAQPAAAQPTPPPEDNSLDLFVAQRPFWEAQLRLYQDVTAAAAALATLPDGEARREAEHTFWRLYYGPMITVEDEYIQAAMVKLGQCVENRDDCDDKEIHNRSVELASRVRAALSASWAVPLPELKGKRSRE
ncbi:MAG: hypothetical protein AB2A00_10795 [Myxococcota bacterium]